MTGQWRMGLDEAMSSPIPSMSVISPMKSQKISGVSPVFTMTEANSDGKIITAMLQRIKYMAAIKIATESRFRKAEIYILRY